jgi:sigma-E factor negative regulatory protein RseB
MLKKQFLIGVVFSLLSLFSGALFAGQDDVWLMLQKASQAARELSYKGVFVYQSGNASKSVQLTHMNYGQGEYARMVVLDGAPREVLSQGSDVVIFSPKNEKIMIEKKRGQNMFPALLPSHMDALKASYQAQSSGIERIGGRDAYVVNLMPKDQMRYGYRFWVDKEFGLLLKVMTLGEHGDALEQIGFSQLTLMDGQNMDWFKPKFDPTKSYVMDQEGPAKANSAEMDWDVTQLPAGYRKVDQVKQPVQGKASTVTQMIFSDGLASISIFIEPLAKGARPKVGHTVVGATNFFALVNEGHQVMVIGEVPEAAVTQFAKAVSFKAKK